MCDAANCPVQKKGAETVFRAKIGILFRVSSSLPLVTKNIIAPISDVQFSALFHFQDLLTLILKEYDAPKRSQPG